MYIIPVIQVLTRLIKYFFYIYICMPVVKAFPMGNAINIKYTIGLIFIIHV